MIHCKINLYDINKSKSWSGQGTFNGACISTNSLFSVGFSASWTEMWYSSYSWSNRWYCSISKKR